MSFACIAHESQQNKRSYIAPWSTHAQFLYARWDHLWHVKATKTE